MSPRLSRFPGPIAALILSLAAATSAGCSGADDEDAAEEAAGAMTEGAEVEVTITGLESSNGQIIIGVFKDDATFQKEEPFLSKRFEKTSISDGTMKVKLGLEPGLYGLTLLDDENGSGVMEYSRLGIPKEGFGFSNYYLSGLKRPKFDAFKFTLESGQTKQVAVKIRRM